MATRPAAPVRPWPPMRCAASSFTGNGTPVPFNFGTVFGTGCYNGCSNDERTGALRYGMLAVPYSHGTLFGYGSYQITPGIKASLQLNYGQSSERSEGGIRQAIVTVRPDNAYLDPAIAAQFGTIVERLQCRHPERRAPLRRHPVAVAWHPEPQQSGQRLFLQCAVPHRGRTLQRQSPRPDARRLHPGRRTGCGLDMERLCPAQRRAPAPDIAQQQSDAALQLRHRCGARDGGQPGRLGPRHRQHPVPRAALGQCRGGGLPAAECAGHRRGVAGRASLRQSGAGPQFGHSRPGHHHPEPGCAGRLDAGGAALGAAGRSGGDRVRRRIPP